MSYYYEAEREEFVNALGRWYDLTVKEHFVDDALQWSEPRQERDEQ